MTSEPVLVAAVQMTSRDDLPANLDRAWHWSRVAVSRGAKLVVLPENVAFMGPEDAKLATAEAFALGSVSVEAGPVARAGSAMARDTGAWLVLGGVAERTTDPRKVHNALLVFAPDGSLVARYRKIHLFDVELADGTTLRESRAVVPGESIEVVETPAGRLGLSICYDVRFPELYRKLVDAGATVLTVPAAFTVPTGRDHWHVLLRARAIESQCHVIAAAQWGSHGHGRTTYGHALVCDPWGTVLAECADGEGVAVAEIDPKRTAAVRAQLPALAHRRLDRGRIS